MRDLIPGRSQLIMLAGFLVTVAALKWLGDQASSEVVKGIVSSFQALCYSIGAGGAVVKVGQGVAGAITKPTRAKK